jgi:hypothetical protein
MHEPDLDKSCVSVQCHISFYLMHAAEKKPKVVDLIAGDGSRRAV